MHLGLEKLACVLQLSSTASSHGEAANWVRRGTEQP